MSESDQITGRQIAAARALSGIGQDDLAKRANVSVATLRRMEASEGNVAGVRNNVLAVRAALEAFGIEFTNGGQPGVRMKLFVDASQPAVLHIGGEEIQCLTLQEAVLEFYRRPKSEREQARIHSADGRRYAEADVARLAYGRKAPV